MCRKKTSAQDNTSSGQKFSSYDPCYIHQKIVQVKGLIASRFLKN